MQLPTTNDSFAPHATELLSRNRRSVYWSAIVLLTLGVGLGFASLSPWYSMGPSVKALTLMAIIWMVIMQWLAAGLGGYLTGRLRNRWHGFHADEGYFRDTVHGFLTWGISTILFAVILSSVTAHSMHMHDYGMRPPGEFHDARMAPPPPNGNGPMHNPPPQDRMDATGIHDGMSEEANAEIAQVALFTAFAMLVGAFVASAAAALGGIHRDEYDAKLT